MFWRPLLALLRWICNNSSVSVMWTGQGNFLTINSDSETVARNSGVFWALLQCRCFILLSSYLMYLLPYEFAATAVRIEEKKPCCNDQFKNKQTTFIGFVFDFISTTTTPHHPHTHILTMINTEIFLFHFINWSNVYPIFFPTPECWMLSCVMVAMIIPKHE